MVHLLMTSKISKKLTTMEIFFKPSQTEKNTSKSGELFSQRIYCCFSPKKTKSSNDQKTPTKIANF